MSLSKPCAGPSPDLVPFSFDGRRLAAARGVSVAAALAENGIVALRRAEAAGATAGGWRGIYCGMGACFDCIVTIDGRTSQRACLAKLAGGEDVRSAPPRGTCDDPLRDLASAPPAGGLPEHHPDVLVVGAGPAGLGAALAARRAGAAVTVLDERADSGGQYYKPPPPFRRGAPGLDRQHRRGAALVRAAADCGVTVVQEATVWGACGPSELVALVNGSAAVYRPRRLILATGAYEQPMPIPGWTLPGVMTAGAAQTLERAYGVLPGRRVVVAGNGPLNFQLAAALAGRGAEVVALVEAAPRPTAASAGDLVRAWRSGPALMAEGTGYLLALRRAGVPILWGHAAVAAEGDGRLARVRMAPLAEDGRLAGGRSRTVEADTLCLGYGFIPSSEIARGLGCRMRADARWPETETVVCTPTGETTVPGVFAVGDGARVDGAAVAEAMGFIAGTAAAAQLGFHADRAALRHAERRLEGARRFQAALWRVFKAPPLAVEELPDDSVLCRCEGISFGTLRREIGAGWQSLATLKRRTRLGMGRCQGRYCAPVAVRLLAAATGMPQPLAGFAPRLPAKPFPAGALGVEKPEWGGHARAGTPDLARPRPAEPVGSIDADIVVIGAGVVGACVACDLAAAGRDVLVVDRDDVNLQASGANAGSLHIQLLSFDFGTKAEAGGGPAAATLPLGPWAVTLWQELAARCGDGFEIRITGGLMVAESEAGMAFLEAKARLERSHGIEAEILGRGELRAMAPALSENLVGAEFAPGEGKINPLTATYAVFERARSLGARFLHSADVRALLPTASGWEMVTSRGVIRAGRIVNAAGPWAGSIGRMAGIAVPVYSAPLQMIVTERAPPLVEQLVAHADRHLSLKQLATGGLVIGGAWTARYDERLRMNVTTRESIEGNLWVARRVLPQLAGLHVVRTWAGMNVNIDGAPIIGEAPGSRGFFNAVTSNGYTLAPAIARLTTDLIVRGRTDVDVRPFLLERFAGTPA